MNNFIKTIICYGLLTMVYAQLYAQVQFQKHYNSGSNPEFFNSAVQVSNGNYIVVGSSDNITSGLPDMIIFEIDVLGNKIREKAFGDAFSDAALYFMDETDTSYVIAGTTHTASTPSDDVQLLSIKKDLTQVYWNRRVHAGAREITRMIQKGTDGYYGVGWNNTGTNGWQYMTYKLNFNGTLAWNRSWGGTGVEKGEAMALTKDGGIIVVGEQSSDVINSSDIGVYKFNGTGNTMQWGKVYSVLGENAHEIIQTKDGNYVMAGILFRANAPTGGWLYDLFMTKIDSVGNLLWSFTYGDTILHNWTSKRIIELEDSSLVIGGTRRTASNGFDGFLIKTNKNGNITWSRSYGSTGNDEIYDVSLTDDGGFILAGKTSSFGAGSNFNSYIIKTDANGLSGCNENTALLVQRTQSWANANRSYTISSHSGSGTRGSLKNVTHTTNNQCSNNDGSTCFKPYLFTELFHDTTSMLTNNSSMWFRFKAVTDVERFRFFEYPSTANNYIKKATIFSGPHCFALSQISTVDGTSSDTMLIIEASNLTINSFYYIRVDFNTTNQFTLGGSRGCDPIAVVYLEGQELVSESDPLHGIGFNDPPTVGYGDGTGYVCEGVPIFFSNLRNLDPTSCQDHIYNPLDNNITYVCFQINSVNTGVIVNNEFQIITTGVKFQCIDEGETIYFDDLPPGCYGYRTMNYNSISGVSFIMTDWAYFCVVDDNRTLGIALNPDPASNTICPGENISASCTGCTTGDIIQSWTINGSTQGYGQNLNPIEFSFNNPGTYNIVMNVAGVCGFEQIERTVTVTKPVADFNDTISCNSNNQPVVTYTDNSKCAVTWHWNFGAGASPSSATGKGPHTVTYSSQGIKYPSLTINQSSSFPHTKQKEVEVVIPSAPVISGLPIACSLSNNVYSVATQPNTTFTWSVTNGSVSPSTGSSVTVTWNNSSGGTVTVTAYNSVSTCTTSTSLIVDPCCYGQEFNPGTAQSVNGSNRVFRDASNNLLIQGNINLVDGSAGLSSILGLTSFFGIWTWTEPTAEVVINGTLFVNGNLTITNSPKIRMGPMARIELVGNVTFTVQSNSVISAACNEMWDGIYATASASHIRVLSNSTIKQAQNAIYSSNAGRFTLTQCILEENFKHVVVRNSSIAHLGNISGTTFRCQNNLIAPYNSPAQLTSICIEVNNVNTITIGEHTNLNNTFTQAATGIWAEASTVNIFNNTFNTITNAVYALQTNYNFPKGNHIVTVGRVGGNITVAGQTGSFSNHFINCALSVLSDKYYKLRVRHNCIQQPNPDGIGVAFLSAPYDKFITGAFIEVDTNLILQGNIGIIGFNNEADIKVRGNRINFDGSTSSNRNAISVRNMSDFFAQYALIPSISSFMPLTQINDNKIDFCYFGITTSFRSLAQILRNEVFLATLPTTPVINNNFGINLISSVNSRVGLNNINAVKNLAIAANETRYRGIESLSSSNTVFYCNSLGKNYAGGSLDGSLGVGFNFILPQAPQTLLNNNISSVYIGLALRRGAAIGWQWRLNNGFVVYDNLWEQSTTSGGSHTRAYTDGNVPVNGMNSGFVVRNVTVPSYRPVPYLPSFGANSVGIPMSPISNPINSVASCQPTFMSPFPATNYLDVNFADDVIGDSLAHPTDSLLYRWWYRYNTYLSLFDNDSLVNANSTLLSFKNVYKNTALPKIDSLKWEAYKMTVDGFDFDSYFLLKDALNSISVDNYIEANYKQMALLQLETYNPSLNYDQQVSLNNAVTAVANWCMFQGGPGVLEARAWLLRNQLNQDFLQWEDSCYTSPPQRLGRFENEEENLVENQLLETSLIDNKKYFLHPNPTKTGFGATIELPQDAEGRVELYTIDGKQIGNYRVKTGSNLIELKDLGSGIYFYRVWINNNLNNTSKLVILE